MQREGGLASGSPNASLCPFAGAKADILKSPLCGGCIEEMYQVTDF